MKGSENYMYSKYLTALCSLHTSFIVCIFILSSAVVSYIMPNQSVWIPIQDVRFKATSYPPSAKNNNKETICTFTAKVKNGRLMNAKLLGNKNTGEFSILWFKKVISSIEMDASFNLSETEFQLRFIPAAAIIGAPAKAKNPISLFYLK